MPRRFSIDNSHPTEAHANQPSTPLFSWPLFSLAQEPSLGAIEGVANYRAHRGGLFSNLGFTIVDPALRCLMSESPCLALLHAAHRGSIYQRGTEQKHQKKP